MSQFHFATIVPADTSGPELAALLDSWEAAVESQHYGTSAPSYKKQGMLYVDGSQSPAHLIYMSDDTTAVDLGALSAGIFSVPSGRVVETAEIDLPSGYLWCDGSAVSRSTYANLLAAITKTVTGTLNGTTGVTAVSVDLTTLGLIGAKVEGTNIQANTTITALTSNTMTLSLAATGSGSGISLKIYPWGNGNGSTTFNVPDKRDRVSIGRGGMGGSAANRITSGNNFDSTRLGNTGGAEVITLSTAQMPVHTHTASSSGSTDTAGSHTHSVSGNTGLDGSHTHTLNYKVNSGGGNNVNFVPAALSGDSTLGLSSNAVTAVNNHTHTINITSASGGSHSHVLTLSTTVDTAGSGSAHGNVQPTITTNFIIKT